VRGYRPASWTRHRLIAGLVLVLSVAVAVGAVADPGFADPAGSDGGNATLQGKLQEANQAYNDAKGRLDAARARQSALLTQIQATGAELASLTAQVQVAAATAYKGGRIGGMSALLGSGSADDFLSRATTLQMQLKRENDALHRLATVQASYAQQRTAIDAEVATQQNQLAEMDKRKKQAQAALAASGGGGTASGPGGGAASAAPAPRNADGSWPKESCSVKDPTTSGCLTPRTLHAYQEVQKAGFTHYVACFRSGTWGEHPLGRACDFSANAKTFVDAAATGADKTYGDRLAAWLLANTDRLAVLYVIWYRQIWMPSTGWRTYHGDGTPAGDHMNHVHLSVQ
jgi:peptidoglycan DL-endopeptidase CwlO